MTELQKALIYCHISAREQTAIKFELVQGLTYIAHVLKLTFEDKLTGMESLRHISNTKFIPTLKIG